MEPPRSGGAPSAMTSPTVTDSVGQGNAPVTEQPAVLGDGPRRTPRSTDPGDRRVAAVVVWLGLMLFATGASGLVALWTAAAFFVPLVLIGSFTRTVSLRLLAWLILIGGFAMALAWLGGALFSVFVKSPTAPLRALVIPPMEEILKLAPVLFVVWRWRRSGTWTFGVTDLLLMGAASGLGFGIVEHAYVAHSRFGWPGQIGLAADHGTPRDAADRGTRDLDRDRRATVGLGLMLRHRPRLAILVGVSGIAWTTLDHIGTMPSRSAGTALRRSASC